MSSATADTRKKLSASAARRTEAITNVRTALSQLRSKLTRIKKYASSWEPVLVRAEVKSCESLRKDILLAIERNSLEADLFILRLWGIDELKAEILGTLPKRQSRVPQRRDFPLEPLPTVEITTPRQRHDNEDVRHMRLILADTASRINELLEVVNEVSVETAEHRLVKFKSRFENIRLSINARQLDPVFFFHELQLIQDRTQDVIFKLESKKNVWWRRAGKLLSENIVKILGPIAAALHLPHLIPMALLTYNPKLKD